jgi:hypothetical protein
MNDTATVPVSPRKNKRDIIFFLLWMATITQAGLILWELLCLTPLGLALFGRYCNPLIHATRGTTLVYMILMAVYAGRNELIRWTSAVNGDGLKSGYLAVGLWAGLLIPSLLLENSGTIPITPHELVRTCIRVFVVFTLSAGSRIAYETIGSGRDRSVR